MKKIYVFLSLSMVLFFTNAAAVFAAGDWANVAAILNVNGTGATNYLLYNAGWSVNVNLNNAPAFDATNLGNVTSLTLNGGIGAGWADNGDYYNGSSFVLYYRVYATTDTPPTTWSNIPLSTQTYQSGNNYEYTTSSANIDLLQQVGNKAGTYYVEITMSKDQFYTGGDWNSMVPGGQSVAYNAANTGYKATFTIPGIGTGITTTGNDNIKWSVNDRTFFVQMTGKGEVELFSVSGQLIDKQEVNGTYSRLMGAGTYIVKANSKTFKVIIP
ncbi:MAG: hypothetical protein ACP5F6_00785 [Microbacter sp.]